MATVRNSDFLLEHRLQRLEACVVALAERLDEADEVRAEDHYERTSAAQAAEIDARHKEVRGY